MRQIQSSLTGRQGIFDTLRERLRDDEFTLSNWEYHSGFFDKVLNEEATVFLRLPIQTVSGQLDDPDCIVIFGVPFVLKHVYEFGVDTDIGYAAGPLMSASLNQFQEPDDKDAEVEDYWVQEAEEIVRSLEFRLI